MEKMIEKVYQEFDAKRKKEKAHQADAQDLEDIKKLEAELKKR
jgi:hypothetical protein